MRCCWECRSCGAFTEREEILVEVVEVCLRARYKNEERKTARQEHDITKIRSGVKYIDAKKQSMMNSKPKDLPACL